MLTAREIAARFGLKRSGGRWSGTCPSCGYPNALGLNEKDGRPLWSCHNNCDQATLTAAITGETTPVPARDPVPAASSGDSKAPPMRFWHACRPAEGTIVVSYLRIRCIEYSTSMRLRFMEAAKHPCGRRLPCMVAVLIDVDGHRTAVHRTFLKQDGTGKTPFDPARMNSWGRPRRCRASL